MFRAIRIITTFLLLIFIASSSFTQDISKVSIFKIMTSYKKMFGKYYLIVGKKAEQQDDEFVFEALSHEAKILKKSFNPDKFKLEDLFLNIRVEDVPLLSKIKKVASGKKLIALIEVRESAVYNKIIPVFILHDFQLTSKGANAISDIETYEDENLSKEEKEAKKELVEAEKPRRKIRIRRKGSR